MQERLAMEETERGGGRCAAAFSWLAREWSGVKCDACVYIEEWCGEIMGSLLVGWGEVERYVRVRAVARRRGRAVLGDR